MMKSFRSFGFVSILSVALMCIFGGKAQGQPSTAPSIVPRPVSEKPGKGVFLIRPETTILVNKESRPIGAYLSEYLSVATGFKLKVIDAAGADDGMRNQIVISVTPKNKQIGYEEYQLYVVPDSINIVASSSAGAFYAVQTLRQLLPAEIDGSKKAKKEWSVPSVTIIDKPRFLWRGLMLDTARHYFPKEFVLRFIDLMAMFKFNRLHLHLTDDQGWRIEIKKYPELTAIGAWRGKSMAKDTYFNTPTGPAHGGFYTQQDIREIVAYAGKRFITVVPEIEMPGHSQAALASYNELSCTRQKFKVLTRWGVNREIFCAGNDKAFEFLQDVLTETAELFPGPYIHIGGDEVPKDRWRACALCQERIKSENLKDESELQSYFIKRIEKFINSKGKTLIGWDEILEGGLPPRAIVMSWRGVAGGVQAANEGHDVIMSPTSNCYFDYPQSAEKEPGTIQAQPLPLCRVYAFEPLAPEISPAEARHVIGAQGNLWTEHIDTESHAEYMMYPRAAALAEVVWSPKEKRNWGDFQSRMLSVYPRLEKLGVNFRRPRDTDAKCQ